MSDERWIRVSREQRDRLSQIAAALDISAPAAEIVDAYDACGAREPMMGGGYVGVCPNCTRGQVSGYKRRDGTWVHTQCTMCGKTHPGYGAQVAS